MTKLDNAAEKMRNFATQQDASDAVMAGELKRGDRFTMYGRGYRMTDDLWFSWDNEELSDAPNSYTPVVNDEIRDALEANPFEPLVCDTQTGVIETAAILSSPIGVDDYTRDAGYVGLL